MQQLFQCYKCGSQNTYGLRFCTVCGEKFQYRCPQCGNSVEPGSRSCSSCAAELDWGVQRQDETPPEESKKAEHKEEKTHDEEKAYAAPVGKSTQRRKTTPWLVAFMAIVLCIVAVFAIDTFLQGKLSNGLTTNESPEQEITGVQITAEELLQAYKADELAADKLYKGEILRVTGKVNSTGENIVGTQFVKLSGGSIEAWGVQCMFGKKYGTEIARLTMSEVVTIVGECDGYLITDVKMKDCVLVD